MLSESARPRVSRETRRLLAAAGLALVALWILARVRFPDRPPTPNPVAPVLSQIAPPTGFADLAGELQRSQQRILPALLQVAGPPRDSRSYPAWPLHEGLALAMFPPGTPIISDDLVTSDPVTGVALFRTTAAPSQSATTWEPGTLDVPRYLIAVTPSQSRPAMSPAYVSSLEPKASPAWPQSVWRVPLANGIVSGAFVFTTRGEWLGIATSEEGQLLIVPAATLFNHAARLDVQEGPAAGDFGIEVQMLTPPLTAATGAAEGVIVAWVGPTGVAHGAFVPGDVISHVNGEKVLTPFAWKVATGRLGGGLPVTIRRHRAGKAEDVVVQVPAAASTTDADPGLTLVREPGAGSRVVNVAAGSAAASAGLRTGDIITLAGTVHAPTPAQIRRAFSTASPNAIVILAVTRGNQHLLAALTR